MKTATIAALIAACLLTGCRTSNDWRTGFGLFPPQRSCANGYYDCSLRTSNQASQHLAKSLR